MNISITKGNGERAAFDANKLRQALEAAGAEPGEQEKIVSGVIAQLYDGIHTRKIYKIAFELLKRESYRVAGRYKLKNAIRELGPTGYPFERFVGKILESMGFSVETGIIIQGHCVKHEVDVVGRRDNEMLMIECKFHTDSQTKSGVQVPLYIHSRFNDVKAAWEKEFGSNLSYRGGVVTNTRFSEDAIAYGTCSNLLMISWDYPADKSLKYWIDRTGLHPVTSLISLSTSHKRQLLDQGIVLCSELRSDTRILSNLGLSTRQISKILNEADKLIAE